MGASVVPVAVITAFWGFIAFILPLPIYFSQRANKRVITVVCTLSGICGWIFWALCYIHQMNPLIGPALHNTTILAIMDIWDHTYNKTNFTTIPDSTTDSILGSTTDSILGSTTDSILESTTAAILNSTTGSTFASTAAALMNSSSTSASG